MNNGSKHIIAALSVSGEIDINNKTDTKIPIPNKTKSNFVNIPKINVPFLAFAGIK